MTIEISIELLVEFKDRMKLGNDEDINLTRILKASVYDLIDKCGEYDIYENERFKELVFERARYVYNDALEFFDSNFQTQITNLALSNVLTVESSSLEGEVDETD